MALAPASPRSASTANGLGQQHLAHDAALAGDRHCLRRQTNNA
jgi:hypothetical protein